MIAKQKMTAFYGMSDGYTLYVGDAINPRLPKGKQGSVFYTVYDENGKNAGVGTVDYGSKGFGDVKGVVEKSTGKTIGNMIASEGSTDFNELKRVMNNPLKLKSAVNGKVRGQGGTKDTPDVGGKQPKTKVSQKGRKVASTKRKTKTAEKKKADKDTKQAVGDTPKGAVKEPPVEKPKSVNTRARASETKIPEPPNSYYTKGEPQSTGEICYSYSHPKYNISADIRYYPEKKSFFVNAFNRYTRLGDQFDSSSFDEINKRLLALGKHSTGSDLGKTATSDDAIPTAPNKFYKYSGFVSGVHVWTYENPFSRVKARIEYDPDNDWFDADVYGKDGNHYFFEHAYSFAELNQWLTSTNEVQKNKPPAPNAPSKKYAYRQWYTQRGCHVWDYEDPRTGTTAEVSYFPNHGFTVAVKGGNGQKNEARFGTFGDVEVFLSEYGKANKPVKLPKMKEPNGYYKLLSDGDTCGTRWMYSNPITKVKANIYFVREGNDRHHVFSDMTYGFKDVPENVYRGPKFKDLEEINDFLESYSKEIRESALEENLLNKYGSRVKRNQVPNSYSYINQDTNITATIYRDTGAKDYSIIYHYGGMFTEKHTKGGFATAEDAVKFLDGLKSAEEGKPKKNALKIPEGSLIEPIGKNWFSYDNEETGIVAEILYLPKDDVFNVSYMPADNPKRAKQKEFRNSTLKDIEDFLSAQRVEGKCRMENGVMRCVIPADSGINQINKNTWECRVNRHKAVFYISVWNDKLKIDVEKDGKELPLLERFGFKDLFEVDQFIKETVQDWDNHPTLTGTKTKSTSIEDYSKPKVSPNNQVGSKIDRMPIPEGSGIVWTGHGCWEWVQGDIEVSIKYSEKTKKLNAEMRQDGQHYAAKRGMTNLDVVYRWIVGILPKSARPKNPIPRTVEGRTRKEPDMSFDFSSSYMIPSGRNRWISYPDFDGRVEIELKRDPNKKVYIVDGHVGKKVIEPRRFNNPDQAAEFAYSLYETYVIANNLSAKIPGRFKRPVSDKEELEHFIVDEERTAKNRQDGINRTEYRPVDDRNGQVKAEDITLTPYYYTLKDGQTVVANGSTKTIKEGERKLIAEIDRRYPPSKYPPAPVPVRGKDGEVFTGCPNCGGVPVRPRNKGDLVECLTCGCVWSPSENKVFADMWNHRTFNQYRDSTEKQRAREFPNGYQWTPKKIDGRNMAQTMQGFDQEHYNVLYKEGIPERRGQDYMNFNVKPGTQQKKSEKRGWLFRRARE